MEAEQNVTDNRDRLAAYLDDLTRAAGHADRVGPMQSYIRGLLLPIERKSIEPMAKRMAPGDVSRVHRVLHRIVADAPWSDQALLRRVRRQVLPAMTGNHPLAAWIVREIGFRKQGTHSVGVTRQVCGQVGKRENCRIAVCVSAATERASLPLAYQLYLPEIWLQDPDLRKLAGIPESVEYRTKPQIALAEIRELVAEDVPPGVVLADAAFGCDREFRDGLEALGLLWCVEIQPSTPVWPRNTPGASKPNNGTPRRPKLPLRNLPHQPCSVRELALHLRPGDLHAVSWSAGTTETMASRFAALRVRVATPGCSTSEQEVERWLLIEWPKGVKEPTRYWLSNLPGSLIPRELVATAKLFGRIQRDDDELKNELGLAHFEGRGWRGFHHHGSLCFAAYGFLILERCGPLRTAGLRSFLLGFRVDRNSKPSISRQIANTLRRHIIERRFKPGDTLPSSHALARQLRVHFTTAVQAYRYLAAEGWVALRPHRGALVLDHERSAAEQWKTNSLSRHLRRLLAKARASGISIDALKSELAEAVKELELWK